MNLEGILERPWRDLGGTTEELLCKRDVDFSLYCPVQTKRGLATSRLALPSRAPGTLSSRGWRANNLAKSESTHSIFVGLVPKSTKVCAWLTASYWGLRRPCARLEYALHAWTFEECQWRCVAKNTACYRITKFAWKHSRRFSSDCVLSERCWNGSRLPC